MQPPKPPQVPPAVLPAECREKDEEPGRALRKERQLKDDGRYMIFFDFGAKGDGA